MVYVLNQDGQPIMPTSNHAKVRVLLKKGKAKVIRRCPFTIQTLKIIQEQEGFIAFLPIYPRGTLCLFKTENDAKGARNMMRFHGIQCGDNICEVYVDKRYVNGKQS